MCCPSGMCVEMYVHVQNPFHNWLCQIKSNHCLSFGSKKSNPFPASSFYWEKGQACWMHSGLRECAISNPSWKRHSKVGTSMQGQAVLGSRGLEGQRQSTWTKQRALSWHWNSRGSCGLGLSLHFHFQTSNGETNTFQHTLPFIYSALPTPMYLWAIQPQKDYRGHLMWPSGKLFI